MLTRSKVTLAVFGILIGGWALVSQDDEPEAQTEAQAETTTGEPMKRVTGIGGIFFKCKDPDKVKEWYKQHLGLKTDQYGALFEFRSADDPEQKCYLQWSPFTDSTKYFEPSQKEFMINYRVENLEALIVELKKEGVQIVGEMQTFEYGKFAHIVDLEGNKIELWEPVDSEFTKSNEGTTTH